ncbi:MAG TPA: hypothetical protein PKA82_18225, partial [Pyrinomonadaceae bacterium]|nr:hypothetical protein [Pyrinomonadaceae bacterium]
LSYMLTGSMALAHYAVPRSTADIDIVIEIEPSLATRFEGEFGSDFYIPPTSMRSAIERRRMFNVLDQRTYLKIDCVVKKPDDFSRAAFSRKRRVLYVQAFEVWIISKEDLIISKLNWAKESRSEKQMNDIASLIRNPFDENYVIDWTGKLGTEDLLKDCYAIVDNEIED